MQTTQQFAELMDKSKDSKFALINFIKKDSFSLLDFGAGSGVLSIETAKRFPNSTIYAFDNNPEMIEIMEKSSENIVNMKVINSIDGLKFDYIALSSLLHEVLSEEDSLGGFFDYLSQHLNENGELLIRDGLSPSKEELFTVKFNDESYLQDFFDQLYKTMNSIDTDRTNYVFELANCILVDDEAVATASHWELKNMLNKLSWGTKSLHREAYELFLVIDEKILIDESSNKFDLVEFKEHCEEDYFNYLSKFADIEEMWNTHFYAKLKLKEMV